MVPASPLVNMIGFSTHASVMAEITMQQRRKTLIQHRLVLVVAGDDALRHSLKFSLEIEGFNVRDYSTAHDLLDGPDNQDAHCLVIDHNLPDMNGFDVLRRLRDRLINVPTIMMTNNLNQSLRESAAASGVRVIEKPLLGNALMDGIRSVMT